MLTVILAGGRSRRMGSDKATLMFGGVTVLEHLVNVFGSYFDSVAVSVGEHGRYNTYGAEEILDIYPGKGPMTGLHAAFARTDADNVFLTAVDLPFGDPELAGYLSGFLDGEYDACLIRRTSGDLEPLFGVYSRRCLGALSDCLDSGSFAMTSFLQRVRVKFIDEDELSDRFDVDTVLSNINTPKDYSRALWLLEASRIPVVSIVGWSGSGKTTYLERLIPELKRRGLRLGVIKHDAHKFEIDRPGKDSYRLSAAGGDVVAVSSAEKLAVVEKREKAPPLLEIISHMMGVDMIITEGYKTGSNPKIEIHRKATGKPLACKGDKNLIAVVTDEELDVNVPELDFTEIGKAADLIMELYEARA